MYGGDQPIGAEQGQEQGEGEGAPPAGDHRQSNPLETRRRELLVVERLPINLTPGAVLTHTPLLHMGIPGSISSALPPAVCPHTVPSSSQAETCPIL